MNHVVAGVSSFPALAGNQAHNAKWVKTDEGWQPSSLRDKIVYPQDGAELDFYAYYPYSRDAINPEVIAVGVKPDQRTIEGRNGSDWMVATNSTGVNEGEVELLFRHVMAAVEVEIRGGNVITPNERLEVQMTEICLKNSFNLGTGVSVAENETGTIDMWRLEDATDMGSFTYRALSVSYTHLDVYKRQEWYDLKLESGDFLKCTSISFGFRVPSKICQKFSLTSLRVNFNVRDVFTISGYSGLDPENFG